MKTVRTILRTFVLGAIAGLLIAPRSGSETRALLQERWNQLLDGAPGMNFDEPGASSSQAEPLSA